ncbi:MAG: hypothetical protein ACSLE0_02920, partial [Chitinophagaceae bacterium]
FFSDFFSGNGFTDAGAQNDMSEGIQKLFFIQAKMVQIARFRSILFYLPKDRLSRTRGICIGLHCIYNFCLDFWIPGFVVFNY